MLFDDPACFRLDRIPVRPIHWLWRPYLACGNPALLDGDPGAGKSLLTADLAARLTRGGRMPDGAWRRRKANVLFLNAEDALDDTLRPRRNYSYTSRRWAITKTFTRFEASSTR
jgi:hypothetical protein